MLKVGITGGMGSGKSTVCRLFALYGIPVYDADSMAKSLMTTKTSLIRSIRKNFGDHVYDKQGHLNRALLGSIVFNNSEKLTLLNSLVHPAVLNDHQEWHRRQKQVPYTIKEAALMFESGSYKDLDLVITVTSPMALRLQRAMARDGSTRTQVLSRMKKQWSETQRNKAADFILINDERHSLIEQVQTLHEKLLAKTNH